LALLRHEGLSSRAALSRFWPVTHITRLPAPSADAISPNRPQWSGRSFVEVVVPRYVSRRPSTFCDSWSEPQYVTNLTVVEADPVPTGLLDSDGNEIYRINDPVGFHF